ncbi:chemotaxis protein CheW [Archangium sp.]|uniref:chemotaxis protein CheW n=1 Tax=Archangium sp. TaxID=1872627 RepID=UPI00389ABCF6
MSENTPTAPTQYLSFFLAGEEYALGILQAREIIEYDTVTRIPGVPAWVCGVCNLRGSVVPVIDLSVRLGMPPATLSRWSCIVVVEVTLGGERVVLGLLVDSIGQVIELAAGEVAPPPGFGTPVKVNYLLGMVRSDAGRKFVLLLDLDKVLGSEEVLSAAALLPPAESSVQPPASPPLEEGPRDSSDALRPQADAAAARE